MNFIRHNEEEKAVNAIIGGKARNLFRLKAIGLNVPDYVVIPQETFTSIVPAELHIGDYKKITEYIQSL